jgi:hypothetical protein
MTTEIILPFFYLCQLNFRAALLRTTPAHHLPSSGHLEFERTPHLLEFALAPDELRQPAPLGKFEVCPQRSLHRPRSLR